MKGFLYKEFRQNLWYILVMPFCGGAGLLLGRSLLKDMMSTPDGVPQDLSVILVTVFGGAVAFLIAGAFQVLTLRGDDRRSWGYFVASTPKGSSGCMRMKYAVIALMSAMCFAGCAAVFGIYAAVRADEGFGLTGVLKTCVYLASMQFIFRAIDIPFIVRFGDKKGSMIKLITLPVIVILFVIFVTAFNFDFMLYYNKLKAYLFSGRDKALKLAVSVAAAAAAYMLSYLISCAVYLKGVDGYDK